MITIDPSKHCHAVKLLGDKADDCEKPVEELTWQLNDDKCQQPLTSNLPIVNGSHSENKERMFPPSASKTLDNDVCISAKTEKPKKGSSLKLKPHISSNIHSQQEAESGHFSATSKRQKLQSSPSKTGKVKKQKITRNTSASAGKSDVDKLSSVKKLNSADAEVKFGGYSSKKVDSAKSKMQLNGDRGYSNKEELGIVSFIDESEMNRSFPPCQKTPLSCPRQESVYSAFESAVIDEYVDREPAANIDRHCSYRDSSDEDAFDLIASGHINKLTRRSHGSRSTCDRSQAADLDQQTDLSTVPAEVDYDRMVTKRPTRDTEADAYDSASSADTDIVIRSHRVMSEVSANLPSQALGSLQPNPNTVLNSISQRLDASGQQQTLNVDENVSSSQNSAASRFSTERKRKRKHSARNDSEVVVKDVEPVASSPSGHEPTPVVASSISTKSLPQNCHSAERKQKQKLSKVDDSDGRVKRSARDVLSLPVQHSESVSVPNLVDIDKSDVKRHKTDVSALLVL